MSKSTKTKSVVKPKKRKYKQPYKGFPLTPHPSGKWQKRIRGKVYYFGRWGRRVDGKPVYLTGDDWYKPALEEYNAQKDDLLANRPRRKLEDPDAVLVKDLCNQFLAAKLRACSIGQIKQDSFNDYKRVTDLLCAELGKDTPVVDLTSDDFEKLLGTMADRWSVVPLGNNVVRVKSVFKYGYEKGLLREQTRFGPEFKKPSASVLRRHRAEGVTRMLEASEIRQLLDAANVELRAMILLGVNCGFNNGDCANLPLTALDLDGGWVNFPRPKTGVPRRCPLWPETIEALREVVNTRIPKLPSAEPLVFVTSRGRAWLSHGKANPVSVAARKLMKRVGVHREGLGFATLRHVYRTVADGSKDQVAVNSIMGHVDPSMAATYRERIDDERLMAVTEHVRQWLFGDTPEPGPKKLIPQICDPSGPCDPDTVGGEASGSHGPNGSQNSELYSRPVLRVFAG